MRMAFTLFVAALIVLPLPPSTLVGMALVSFPPTAKHMDPRIIGPVQRGMQRAKAAVFRR